MILEQTILLIVLPFSRLWFTLSSSLSSTLDIFERDIASLLGRVLLLQLLPAKQLRESGG
jgi:hypothetical protein